MTYFDGGRKRAVLHERESQLSGAKENLAKLTDEVDLVVQTCAKQAGEDARMLKVPEEVLVLRSESNVCCSKNCCRASAVAQEYDAKPLLLHSELDYSKAYDEFVHAMGRTPK